MELALTVIGRMASRRNRVRLLVIFQSWTGWGGLGVEVPSSQLLGPLCYG